MEAIKGTDRSYIYRAIGPLKVLYSHALTEEHNCRAL